MSEKQMCAKILKNDNRAVSVFGYVERRMEDNKENIIRAGLAARRGAARRTCI